MRLRKSLTALLLGATVAGGTGATPAAAGVIGPPLSQPACPGPAAQVSVFVPGLVPVAEWRENLAFDGLGGMWVSNTGWNAGQGRIERYAPDGTMTVPLPLEGPLGLVRGHDGWIYAAGAMPGQDGTLFRFDPSAPAATLEPFGDDVPVPNGMVFDDERNLYISYHGDEITKIRPDGTVDANWTEQATVWDANGLAVADDTLYANVSFDQRSPIKQVPLADPDDHATFVELSFGVASTQPEIAPNHPGLPLLPKGLDDLTVAPGGYLYTTAFVTGELLRVDRQTGEACVLVSGLTTPTSVRFPRGFGSHHPTRDLFVTEATGNIRNVHLPG